ncbi:MAG: HDOD domain-containing protein [Gammaproteobacteria bacterium]|nr:MAG: HDOD domain-containing protein [Gammaproteobacteria bacterium]
MNIKEQFLAECLQELEAKRLVLPTLPELAIRVRQAVDDPHATAAKVAKVISTDAAISAHLIRIANSAFYRGRTPVEDLPTAVTRLGLRLVRNLVMGLVIRQLYQVRVSPPIRERLAALQALNTRVAAHSHVLAQKFTSLQPDVAMLGGLIHRIGELPILLKADKVPELLYHPQALDGIIEELHRPVGIALLKAWNFPETLITVVAECENLQRSPPQVDYADVVLVARLLVLAGTDHPAGRIPLEGISAFSRLDMTPERLIEAMREAKEAISEMEKLLS